MNSEDLKRLGQIIKSKYPEYAGASDEEVGRIIAKKYPQYAKELGTPEIPVMTGSEVQALEGETVNLQKYSGYLSQQAAVKTQVQSLRRLGTADQQLNEATEANHRAVVSTAQSIASQAQAISASSMKAIEVGLDQPTFVAIKVEEAKANIEVAKHAALIDLELDKNRAELKDQIQAALIYAQQEKHQILHIQDEVLKLLEKRYAIQCGFEPPELKAAKLEVLDGVITGFIGQLSGLLQGPTQKID